MLWTGRAVLPPLHQEHIDDEYVVDGADLDSTE